MFAVLGQNAHGSRKDISLDSRVSVYTVPAKKSQPVKKKLPKLTIKQCRLVEFLARTKTQREAAILAGYKDCPHIRQTAHKALMQIRRKAPDILEEMGLTLEAVAYNNLLPLVNAKEVKFLNKDTEFVELEALDIQLRALDMYFKLMGAYAPKEQIEREAATLRAIVLDAPRPPRILPESKNEDTK